MRKKFILRSVVFLLILAVLLAGFSKLVTSSDSRAYQWVAGFYEEREDSLDAVYLGSSCTYAFWAAPLAWEQYGIAIYPFTSPVQPLVSARFLVEEARKTQPDALYIIPLNGVYDDDVVTDVRIHYLTDYMPPSITKYKMTQFLCDIAGFSWDERMQFFLPFTRYHSRWDELTEKDFHSLVDGLKGGSTYGNYLKTVTDASKNFRSTTRRLTLCDTLQDAMEDLLAYCDAEQLKVLFVTTPQACADESHLAKMNTIMDLVRSRGYPVLNMMERTEEIGLDLTQDYYDNYHTNLHGAIKMTNYLSKYLVEHYEFQDKRGNEAYSDWDEAFDKYEEIIAPYAVDLEYGGAARNDSLGAPELTKVSVCGTDITLNWNASAGADGYWIYRKEADSGWTMLGSVEADTLSYLDRDCSVGTVYTYTVIPYQGRGDSISWGRYHFNGVTATATLAPPELKADLDEKHNLVLTWDSVDGADGYAVFRRVSAKTWFRQTDVELETSYIDDVMVELETSYIDDVMLENIPYEYRVRAYYLEGETVKWGSYSNTYLWVPDLPGPQVSAAVEEGRITLSWPPVEGISGYIVFRKTADSGWTQISEPLGASCSGLIDWTAQAGVPYIYQVVAYLKFETDTYEFPAQPTQWLTADTGGVLLEPADILYAEEVGGGIQLVWSPQENATAYRVYRKAEGQDSWTQVQASVSSNTYLDTPKTAGIYTYAVQSLYKKDGCTYYGNEADDSFAVTAAFGISGAIPDMPQKGEPINELD